MEYTDTQIKKHKHNQRHKHKDKQTPLTSLIIAYVRKFQDRYMRFLTQIECIHIFIFIFIFYIVFELYLYWVVGGIYMYGGCWRREGPIISLFVTLSSSEVWLIDWFSYKLIQKRLESNEYWIRAATTDDEWVDLCHLSAPTINWGSGSMWRRSLVEL